MGRYIIPIIKKIATYILIFAIILIGGHLISSLFLNIAKYPIDIFQWDEWDVYQRFLNYSNYKYNLYNFTFSQHNEHVPFFSNLIFLLWVVILKGNDYINGWIQAIFLLIEWLVFLKYLKNVFLEEKNKIIYIAFCCFIFLTSDLQFENLIRVFNLQVIMVVLFSTLSFYLISTNNNNSLSKLFFSIFFAFCSSFSMAGGLGCWLIIVFYLLFIVKNKKFAIIYTAATLLCFLLFFNKYELIRGNLPHQLSELPNIIIYSILLLGNQLMHYGFIVSLLGGIIVVTIFFNSLYIALRNRKNCNYDFLFLTGFFSIILALEVSIGRANFGLMGALSSRYLTFSAPLWACLAVIVFIHQDIRGRYSRYIVYFQRFLIFSGIVLVLLSQGGMLYWVEQEYIKYEKGSIALFNGALDSETLKQVHPSGINLINFIGDLRADNIAPFSIKKINIYNKSVELLSSGKFNGAWCKGAVDSLPQSAESVNEANFHQSSGWGWNYRLNEVPDFVLFVDKSGRPVGSGSFFMLYNKNDPAKYVADIEKLRIGWYGYVSSIEPRKYFTYLYSASEEELCLIH